MPDHRIARWRLACRLPLAVLTLSAVLGPRHGVADVEQTESKGVFATPAGLTRLAPDADVWHDIKQKRVIVDGRVCLRRGALEMFACSQGTKEHESIVAVNSKAQYVHAALLAVGAKSGHPAQFDPEYKPATGTTIAVLVLWKDEAGKTQQVRAQEWMKNTRTGRAAKTEWVFAGSGFWTDPSNGERYYHGDGGDFICVSNFPTATLDLTIASSKENASLLFEARTEKIPPVGTPVRLLLVPKIAKEAATARKAG
jgi:hypothetical protein